MWLAGMECWNMTEGMMSKMYDDDDEAKEKVVGIDMMHWREAEETVFFDKVN